MERIISAAFSFLIGTVGLWAGFKQLRNRTALNTWPTTKGKVIERGTYQPFIPAAGPPAFRHSPLVKYVYQVSGKEFTNDCIRPKRIQLPQHNTKEWAQKRAESFPDEVAVHYNPEDPSESFPRPNLKTNAVHCDRFFVSGYFVWVAISASFFAEVKKARP